eukprot:m.47568 g.47568  ORF g.47568 m.47568 type:complete len:413 (+) comp11931_c0_seq1:10-1248(+)
MLLPLFAIACLQTTLAAAPTPTTDGFVGLRPSNDNNAASSSNTLYLDPPLGGSVLIDGFDCKAGVASLAAWNTTLTSRVDDLSAQVDAAKALRVQLTTEVEQLRDAVLGLCQTLKQQSIDTLAAGHTGIVTAVAAQGNRLYSATNDHTIVVWDTHSPPRKVHTLSAHTDHVRCLAVDNATNRLFSGSTDGTIRVWDTAATPPALLHTLTGHTRAVISLVIHGARLYSGSWDATIGVWDVTQAPPLNLHNLTSHSGDVSALAARGNRLFSGSVDDSIRVWDLTQSPPFVLHALTNAIQNDVQSLAIHNNRLFAGDQSAIHVWDLTQSPPTHTHSLSPGRFTRDVWSLVIHDDRLYSSSSHAAVAVWDLLVDPAVSLGRLIGHDGSVLALAVHDNRLYSGSDDQTIRAWDISPC